MQFARTEDDKADDQGKPIKRFKAGDRVSALSRPRMEGGVPVIQKVSGELV